MQKRTPMRQLDDRTLVPEHTYPLNSFEAVGKHKSVWRAIRKGMVSRHGNILPSRPFNNSKRTRGRKLQKEFEKSLLTVKGILAKAQRIDSRNAK